ncbi:ATP-binding protein [Spirochaeta dissipatitropha]
MGTVESPMIGLLIGSSTALYSRTITQNLHAATQKFGFKLTCFLCNFLRYYTDDIPEDYFILDFVGSSSLDALIIGGMVSDKVLKRIIQRNNERTTPVPIVCLTNKADEVHSVLIDNSAGFRELMAHLLDHHKFTRLALIGGPKGQSEAEVRKNAFIQEMEKRNLEVREDWIVHGDFHTNSGAIAMKELLKSDDLSFEGVVVVTDPMAVAAQKHLESAGYKVPDDIFVTGFDDMLPSSLTTVRQPFKLQVQKAVELIHEKLNGEQVDACLEIPSMLKIRSSCGCGSRDLLEHLSDFILNNEIMYAFFQKLETSFLESLEQRNPDIFLSKLLEYMSDVAFGFTGSEFTGAEWRVVFRLIERNIRIKSNSKFDTDYVDFILDKALMIVMNAPLNADTAERFFSEEEYFTLIKLNQSLNKTSSQPELIDLLASSLPELGFRGGRLALISASGKKASLKLVYNEIERKFLPEEGVVSSLHDPHPELFRQTDNPDLITVVQPLFFYQDLNGFLSVDANLIALDVLDTLSSHISNTIRSIRLWEERIRSEEQMIQSEKMAALGKLVAGIAHEINTPIGIGLTTASDLRLRAEEILEHHGQGSLTRTLFYDFLQILDEETSLIEGNLVRAADLIRSFKTIAVDQSNEEFKSFNLKQYLEDIVTSLKPKLGKKGYSVTISCSDEIAMFGPPGTIAQIISNLVTNSIVHGFDSKPGGEIMINCSADKNSVLIHYSDNGKGVSREIVEDIFEPFFTTRMGQGGSGLGLYIVYNLMHRIWKGNIRCESSPGIGTSFHMTFAVDCRDPKT